MQLRLLLMHLLFDPFPWNHTIHVRPFDVRLLSKENSFFPVIYSLSVLYFSETPRFEIVQEICLSYLSKDGLTKS